MAAKNQNALDFIEEWKNKGDEKQDSQKFWFSLFKNVLGVPNPENYLNFEQRVQLGHTSFMDVYIPQTKVIIEQKGKEIDLRRKAKQSDGQELTPFEQARRYNVSLPHSQKARWIVTCNFQTFLIYDMEEDPNGLTPLELKLEDLGTKYNELKFLAEYQDQKIIEEQKLSIKAGELIGQIYDLLKPQYKDPENPNSLKSLNKLCVRLVFCLYAEDAGLFDRQDNHIFGNYLKKTETKHLRKALIDLFTVLNQDPDKNERDPYLEEDLARFPYVNGNLFKIESPETDEIPNFTDDLKHLLIEECSESFDWADISPTIFGALFESTLNPDTRRSGGMHYTSIENIHKVIDPLFLDDLKAEFDHIKEFKTDKKINQECFNFQQKLASIKFLDPACGSGNFLTETYLCLRRLENDLILFQSKNQNFLPFENPVKVSIKQFYGIEINDFAVAVANTALWIAESQMLHETENIIHREIDFLPLKTNSNIQSGNALTMNWEQLIPNVELNYIMGNPPFIGARWMKKSQKQDVIDTFGKDWQGVGDLDYVCCWYKKTADYIKDNKNIFCAFVSTNSISQGGAVTNLWKPLVTKYDLKINYAYQTFIWNNEAKNMAKVHCIIVGFSFDNEKKNKFLFSNELRKEVLHINGYLVEGEDVYIDKRNKPISNVPSINLGGQAIDDGNLILTQEEKNELLAKEPISQKYIRPYMMGKDFIARRPRFCLWLNNAEPSDIKKCPTILTKIDNIKKFREASNRESTKRAAAYPSLFGAPFECKSDYIAIPKVSSERRIYIPIDYLPADIIPGDKLFVMENASMFHFGIMTSIVHMAWLRVVAGRLKSDYSYSNTIVYNNFVWPEATEKQKEQISKTAQAILDARALYPDSSLADLYDPLTMPLELIKAHKANDKAVLALYGFKPDATEEEIVAKLMQMYAEKVKGE
ncbi:DNA methyltransferase [Succinivibrio sp.]|uniref:DNA methyltransferase n=1 Tax=Succinivibrio sp. TaxID=2053619 RepID=UPI0025896B38|nr:DNA methyltransferase [Succinivibrio sp.]MDD6206565.1 N-6 DNA methylase [Succinivibrio sp.]